MSFSHTITQGWASGGDSLTQNIVKTTDAEDNRDISFLATATTHALINLPVTALASLYMLSDQAIAVKTNSPTAPDDTITLVANEPRMWCSEMGYASPITVAVTQVYVVNLGSAGILKLRSLQDSTP